jgi:type IV fimbrial biogenesis protein FimT
MAARRGFTLIELMVALAVLGILAIVAAPSFVSFIEMQRLRGVNHELLSDIQFVRSEALRRGERVGMRFGGSGTMDCYTIYRSGGWGCDCTRPPGQACVPAANELRTVQLHHRHGVRLVPPAGLPRMFEIDPVSGGIRVVSTDFYLIVDYPIEVSGVSRGRLRSTVGVSGRPTSCTPNASVSGVATC